MRSRILPLLAVVATTTLAFPGGAGAQASFQVLEGFDFDNPEDHYLRMSGDGRTVVGYVEDPVRIDRIAARWDEGTGLTLLPRLPVINSAQDDSEARAISADGSTIVGTYNGLRAGGPDAVRYVEGGEAQVLELNPMESFSEPIDISADGSIVVGLVENVAPDYSIDRAFIWDESRGRQFLGDLTDFGDRSFRPESISDDGLRVAGTMFDRDTGVREAAIWTESGGLQGLGVTEGSIFTYARGMSADGSTVVGYAVAAPDDANSLPVRWEAIRWTAENGIEGLGRFSRAANSSIPLSENPERLGRTVAYAVSADGSVIVGASSPGLNDAWIYDERRGGMRSVQQLLVQLGVSGLDGYELISAVDVSADGRVITGWGYGPDTFGTIAWRAVIPEPSTGLLLGLGLLALGRRQGPRY